MAINKGNDQVIRMDLFFTRREYFLLKKIAAKEGIGVGEYISNIVRNWTFSQMRGKYRKLFDDMNILECANLFGDIKDDGEINFETSVVATEKQKVKDRYKEKS